MKYHNKKFSLSFAAASQRNMMDCTRCAIFLLLIALGHTEDDKLQVETRVVNTPLGPVKGLKLENQQTGKPLYEFRGIRYGKPPVGPLRFKQPVPVEKWEDTLDATTFGAACPQFINEMMADFKPRKMSEDCLFLNVYVPAELDLNKKLTVMVWIHGGGLTLGFGDQYDGGWIATEGNVIIVTINYRMNLFGFLSVGHPASKGNYGLWDQKLALQWVHDNIHAFGGDPESVTIFGQSGGGWSTSFQSLIPSNRGLFQRVISQSGVVGRINLLPKNSIQDLLKDLKKKTACPTDDMYKFVDCLREKTMEELVNTTDFMSSLPNDKLDINMYYQPVVDGDLYPEHPIWRLEDSNSEETKFFESLDFMTGTTSNEGSLVYMMIMPSVQEHYGFNSTEGIPTKFVCQGVVSPFVDRYFYGDSNIKKKICEFYTDHNSLADQSMRVSNFMADIFFGVSTIEMLEFHASSKRKTFQYVFSKPSERTLMGPPPSWAKGVGHGEELQYMFDAGTILPSLKGPGLSENDQVFSKRLIRYWTSFAKSG